MLDRAHPLARGLLARYLLNEGSGTRLINLASKSPGVTTGNTGTTLTNMDPPTDWIGSARGGGLDFDGTDDHAINSTLTGLNGSSAGSLVCWFRTDTAGAGLGLVSCPNVSATPPGFDLRFVGTGANSRVGGSVVASGGSVIVNSDVITYNDNRWHQLVMTFDGTTTKLYLDNRLHASSTTASGTITAPANELNIGRLGSSGNYANVQIDDVRVYNRALHPEEVAWLYADPYADTPFAPWAWVQDRAHAAYEVEAELNGAGNGWTDLTADLMMTPPLSIDYGIPGAGHLDLVAETGRMAFALNNGKGNSGNLLGYYSPEHANARTGFKLGIGIRARFQVGTTSYFKFSGRLESIDPMYGQYRERKTLCMAVDWMDEAARFNGNVVTQVDRRTDQVLEAVVAPVPRQPVSMTFDEADYTFRYALDNTQSEGQPILTEIQRLAQSEYGHVFIKGDTTAGGRLTFQRYSARLVPSPVATFADTMVSLLAPHDRNLIRNRVKVTVHPRTVDAVDTTVLYTLLGTPDVAVGETITITGRYNDPAERANRVGGTDMRAPVATTDYTMNTQEDGLGTNLTASFVVAAAYGGNSVEYTITNNSGSAGFITLLQARGRGLYDYNEYDAWAVDQASIDDYGERPLYLDMPYQHGGVIARNVAAFILSLASNPAPQEVTMGYVPPSDSQLGTALAIEPGDAVTVTETATGLASTYWVQHVSIRVEDNLPRFEWLLKLTPPSPVVRTRATSVQATDATSHVVSLPSGIVAGDLLIVVFANDGTPALTWPAGWTEFLGFLGLSLAYREADGTEPTTITLTTDVAEQSAHSVLRIAGAKDPAIQAPEVSSVLVSTSDAPNPPSLSPTGGVNNFLWLAVCSVDNGQASIESVPANYTDTNTAKTGTVDGVLVATAERSAVLETENPGAFGLDASHPWQAVTVAVHPA